MLGEDLFQQRRAAVIGKADSAHTALRLFPSQKPKAIQPLHLPIGGLPQAMEQVVVEVIHPAALQLFGKIAVIILRTFRQEDGQLGSKLIGRPGMPGSHQFPENSFAGPCLIGIGGVKVAKSMVQEGVNHPFDSLPIHRCPVGGIGIGQPHQPKAQFFHCTNSSLRRELWVTPPTTPIPSMGKLYHLKPSPSIGMPATSPFGRGSCLLQPGALK